MAESDLWRLVKKYLEGPGRHLVRVENPVMPGTPDVNYCINGIEGWIELKQIEAWPIRRDTPVRIPHYTSEQRLWIRRRSMAEGRVFLLLRVVSTMSYLLFPGSYAWDQVGNVTAEQLKKHALCRWNGAFDDQWLISILTS